jgi:hypothetical protein
MSFSIQWDRAFIHVSSCGCFCGRTHRSTGSRWKVAVPWRELALQDCARFIMQLLLRLYPWVHRIPLEGCGFPARSGVAGLSILSDFVGAMLNAGGSRIGVCVGSVNRCEMPMAGRGHLHPQAHRADGQDQSCKRSLLMPERRVQRGSGPEEDPYQAKQLQQTQER